MLDLIDPLSAIYGTACVFLASPYAAAMTGETLYIDGGFHILA